MEAHFAVVTAAAAAAAAAAVAMATETLEQLIKSVETVDEFLNIWGDDAKTDMLFVCEVFAEWCGPSQAAVSTYRKIKDANEAKKFKLCRVCASLGDEVMERVQENPLEKYKILARPTFILYKDGEQVGIVDGVSMPTLEKLIGEHMPEGLLEEEEAAADDEAGEED